MKEDEIQEFIHNLSNYENISELFYKPSISDLDFKQVNKILFYSVTICAGLLCNGLIICVLACTKSLRTKFNLYIINLAVAGILVTCVCSWVHLLTDLKQNWVLGDLMCRLNTFLQVMVVSASILTLTITVLDRFLAAHQPQYLQFTQRCQSCVILTIWTIACLTALPWLLYMRVCHMTLTLLVVFFVCWTPQQVTLVWDVYRDKHKPKPAGIGAFKYSALFLAYSSSAIHPIVYISFNKYFRVAALQTLRLWRRGANSVIAVQPAPSSDPPV